MPRCRSRRRLLILSGCRLLFCDRRLFRWIQPSESLVFPTKIAKSYRQAERDQNQEKLPDSRAFMIFFVLKQVMKVARRGSAIGIDADTRPLRRGHSARWRIIESQKRRPADRGGIVGHRNRSFAVCLSRRPRRGSVRAGGWRGTHSYGLRGVRWRCRRKQRGTTHPAKAVIFRIFIAATWAAHRFS